MRDAMAATTAAVFEPEEAGVLEAAFKITRKKLGTRTIGDAELARVIHNLGRSRLRLNKQLQTRRDAADVADEAVEHITFIEGAPEAVVRAASETCAVARAPARIIGAFPQSFRQPPANRL